jgi:hypothetical protein
VNKPTNTPAQKKPYAAPKLVAYGTVSKLTQTGVGSFNDGAPGGMTQPCL